MDVFAGDGVGIALQADPDDVDAAGLEDAGDGAKVARQVGGCGKVPDGVVGAEGDIEAGSIAEKAVEDADVALDRGGAAVEAEACESGVGVGDHARVNIDPGDGRAAPGDKSEEAAGAAAGLEPAERAGPRMDESRGDALEGVEFAGGSGGVEKVVQRGIGVGTGVLWLGERPRAGCAGAGREGGQGALSGGDAGGLVRVSTR